MEVLATIGVAAKELFEYNRDMYQFDQEQRLDRDLLRLEMQVKRFKLFREDIRDLVELTVGKMEMYHAVGALALWFCVTWYAEGRIRAPEAPPFILSLYWMSVAGAFVYLLLTVWLSMHASVTSHSIGVRLLTRYVRLPIPGLQQLNALNPRLTDFENQGAKNVLRVPFISSAQGWLNRARGLPSVMEGAETDGKGGYDQSYNPLQQKGNVLQVQDLLDTGEAPIVGERNRKKSARRTPGKHIQLFRNLQMKWQCYDAYARVCMSLGMNQVLMAACFYLICATLLEYHSPSLCFALIFIFQGCSLAMSLLDISGVKRRKLVALWFFGSLVPLLIAATEVTVAKHWEEQLAAEQAAATPEEAAKLRHVDIYENKYYTFGAIPFFMIAGWMVGLLCLAWPSADEKTLPRLFRAVLFVDVFALEDDNLAAAGGRHDGGDVPTKSSTIGSSSMASSVADPHLTQERAAAADEACYLAEAGLRRWEAVPAGTSEASTQGAEVARLRRNLTIWRKALNNEAARIAGTHGDMDAVNLLEVDTRTWGELSADEQAQDPWVDHLLGPFEHNTLASHYYYDLEGKQFVWEVPEGRDVLTLQELQNHVENAEDQVRGVFSGDRELPTSSRAAAGDYEDEDECQESLKRAGCCCCVKNKLGKPAFVPERLPWFSLSWMTWTLVIAWIFEGTCLLLEQHEIINIDKPELVNNGETFIDHSNQNESDASSKGTVNLEADPAEAAGIGSHRRHLAELRSARWNFSAAGVSWPRGLFFRPEGLACLPEPGGSLLVGGSEALHWAPMPDAIRPSPLQLTVLSVPPPPPGAVALCGPFGKAVLSAPDAAFPSLMGAPSADGIAFWRPDGLKNGRAASEKVILPVHGRPWRRMAGAAVRCAEVADLMLHEDPRLLQQEESSWCLLLVGWDGERLPVAALRLPEGPVAAPPNATARIAPAFDVPLATLSELGARRQLATTGIEEEIVGLHVEPQRGRLWALRSGGGLLAWDLKRLQPLGRWQPDWSAQQAAAPGTAPGAFRATALCEDRLRSRLMVLGRHGTAGPQLLWADLPEAMRDL